MATFVGRLRDARKRALCGDLTLAVRVADVCDRMIDAGIRDLADHEVQGQLRQRIHAGSHSVEKILADVIHAMVTAAGQGFDEADVQVAALPAAQGLLEHALELLASAGMIKPGAVQHARVLQLVLLALCNDYGADPDDVEHFMSLNLSVTASGTCH